MVLLIEIGLTVLTLILYIKAKRSWVIVGLPLAGLLWMRFACPGSTVTLWEYTIFRWSILDIIVVVALLVMLVDLVFAPFKPKLLAYWRSLKLKISAFLGKLVPKQK